MGKRTKLEKFAENSLFPNVFENFSYLIPKLNKGPLEVVDYKSFWSKNYFKNNFDLVLELACGGGEYSIGLAKMYPNKNFIGIDIKGARIWKGAQNALNLKLDNVAFVRSRIELLHHYFDKKEIAEIWITFPDPFLKKGKEKKRLTSPFFLDLYEPLLSSGSILHLKTDDVTLYESSLHSIQTHPNYEIIYHHFDIYSQDSLYKEWDIKTYYELKHLADNKKIKYIRFAKK